MSDRKKFVTSKNRIHEKKIREDNKRRVLDERLKKVAKKLENTD